MKHIKSITLLISLGVLLMGCSEQNKYSPEQVIRQALEETEDIQTYYGESTLTSHNDEIDDLTVIKEWRHKDGRVRIETEDQHGELLAITVNDGTKLITYDIEQGQASIIDDPELMSLNQRSPREQSEFLLAFVQDTHDLTMEGVKEISGREVHHLVATPREKDTLFGKQELWIDKQNWIVLKMISEAGDHVSEVIYNQIDFDVDIPVEKFTIDLPSDVEMIDLDDVYEVSEVSLSEAKEGLGTPFLYIPEDEDLHISTIEMDDIKGIVNRVELNIDYKKNDLPFITLSIFETPTDLDDDMTFPGETTTTVRNQEATFTDLEGFRSLLWEENGLTYSVIIIDPNVTLEDMQTLADMMELVD